MNRSYVSAFRFLLLVFAVLSCFVVLLGRLYYLHVVQHERLAGLADKARNRVQVVNARRGDIVDARGNLLATTNAVYTIGLDPHSLKEEDYAKIPEIARLLDLPEAKLTEAFDTRYRLGSGEAGKEPRAIRWTKLAENVEEPVYEQLSALGVRAVYGNRQYMRVYPGGELAAHVLGYVNKEAQPVMGVESYLDFYLRGQDGWHESERDGRRQELAQFRRREVEATNGLSVELSLSASIQHAVEEEVRRVVAEFNPQAVTIIVGEPATGYILAMANYPSFDPNHFWDFPIDAQRNRAVTDMFEPGSTFKIVPAAAALNEGLVKADTVFDCAAPTAEYKGRTIKLPGDAHRMEDLTVEEIVYKSSNRGAAQLGILLGEQKLYQYARAFGYGEASGYAPSPEAPGTLHPVSAWDGLTISRLPMGHAVSATPIQVHAAMGSVANGGVLMEPQVVRRVFDESGETVVRFAPRARRRAVTPETAAQICDMLEKVVGGEGTAKRAFIEDYAVAGKTGTTQKIIDGRYSSQHHVASFSGFFPADSPRLVITVVVDDPEMRGPAYGGLVAAPAFRNVAKHCISTLGIPPVETDAELVSASGITPSSLAENSARTRPIATAF